MAASFAALYPNLAYWIESFGWIELGQDEFSTSLIRVLDIGGMVWESEAQLETLDEALQAAELAVTDWLKEQGFEDSS